MTLTDHFGVVHDIREVRLNHTDTIRLIPCSPFSQPDPTDTVIKPLTCLTCVALALRPIRTYNELVSYFGMSP